MSDGDEIVTIPAGEALAIGAKEQSVTLTLRAHTDSRVVIVTGEPIAEAFIQRGPFVMSTEAEIVKVEEDCRTGRLGKLSD